MDYIENTLGVCVEYRMWDKERKLPYFIIDRYKIEEVDIEKIKVLFLYPKTNLEPVNSLKKHIISIQRVENIPVVLVLDTISRQRRETLIASHIPFVVPEKQLYLPFLGVALQEKYDVGMIEIEKFQPSAQILFFYYLYQKQEKLYTNNAVEALGFSAMTITRATRQLVQTGLFETKKDGVQKILIGKMPRRELYRRALAYLINPVRKRIYVEKDEEVSEKYLAGSTALARMSMMNKSSNICYAVGGSSVKHISGTTNLLNAEEQMEVEVWKYNPAILSEGEMVDPLSLIVSLQDEKDERIEQALDEILEKILEE